MIKGCQRKIILVKDTGSPYFDSAYFVLKSNLPSTGKYSDMLSEANKIIAACNTKVTPSTAAHRPKKRHFCTAAITVACACAALFLGAAIMAVLLL